MARRRLTPAQPSYLVPGHSGPQTEAAPAPIAPQEMPPIARVAGEAASSAAAHRLAAELQAAKDTGRMVIEVPLADISPLYLLRDRMVLDREELDMLKRSIQEHGQRIPAEITPLLPQDVPADRVATGSDLAPYGWGLISGWRRLRALSELLAETQDPRFAHLRALVRQPDGAAESYVAMVEENEVRCGLSYYERARLVAETTERGVFADRSAALRALFGAASRAKRSKIGSFVELHLQLGDRLHFPTEIPERLGLALVAALREGRGPAIRAALEQAQPGSAAAEIALLQRQAKPVRPPVSRAKPLKEQIRPGVELAVKQEGQGLTLTLSGDGVNEALLETLRAALK